MKIALYTSNRTTIPPAPNVIAASAALTATLADGLVEQGHEVTLFAAKGSQTKAKLIDLDLPPSNLDFSLTPEEWVKNMNLGMKQVYLGELYKRASDFDVIHLQTEPVYLGMPFANLSDTPTVITNHNVFIPQERPLLEYYRRQPIVTISEYQRHIIPTLNYVATVYDGINVHDFPFTTTVGPDGPMLFMGRLVAVKGVSQAIEVSLATKRALTLSGAGKTEYVESVVPKNNPLVEYVGMADKASPQWFKLLANSKLTLFPIQWEEPFGLVMIESMACGTPVIALARGSVSEIIEDGVTGYIVNVSDEDKRGNFITKKTGLEGLVEAVERLYSLPQKAYQAMRQAARDRVEKRFSIEQMITGYERVYEQVAA